MENLEIIIDGKKIEVAEKGFPSTMDWTEANKACSDLGDGWRLPTIKELKEIYRESEFCRKNFNFNFESHSYYWAGNSVEPLENVLTFDDSGNNTFETPIETDNESEKKAALYFSSYEPDSLAGYYRDFDKSEVNEGFRVRAVRDL